MTNNPMTPITQDPLYIKLLQEVKMKVSEAQLKAMVSVNQKLLLLYWEIGKGIIERQKQTEWGDKMLVQLSKDLKLAFPGMKGFSLTNLKYMRQFATAYESFPIGQAPLDQISWYHNITLLSKCPDETVRLWYAQKTLENSWSRNVMVHQIESKLYERKGNAQTNFQSTLPKPQSDLADETMKDPYIFDFLTLKENLREKELEDA